VSGQTYIETEWTVSVNDRQVACHRTSGMGRETYVIDDDGGKGLVFTDKHLPGLRAFLAALDADPQGARIVRCKHCDERLQWSTCSVDGVEVPDTYDGPWVDENGTSRCEESPNGNEAWESAHEPNDHDICLIKRCLQPRGAGLITCIDHEDY